MKKTKIRKKTSSPVGYKFLLRTLKSSFDRDVLCKARVKGLYFKRLIDPPLDEHTSEYLSYQVKTCIRRKMFNYLTDVSLTSFHGFRFLKDFNNNIRNLKRFKIEDEYDSISNDQDFEGINFLLKHIKLFPKNIESIAINHIDLNAKEKHFRHLYRTLTLFRKLKQITRGLSFETQPFQVSLEYPYLNRFLPRLSQLKEFRFSDHWVCYGKGFQEVLKKGIFCPGITHLTLQLVSLFLVWDEDRISEVLGRENSVDNDSTDQDDSESGQDNDSDSDSADVWNSWFRDQQEKLRDLTSFEELDDSGQLAFVPKKTKERMVADKVISMFQLHLFPNLKSLTLNTWSQKSFVVGSYVVDAFESLKNLKCLVLSFYGRLKGTKFFFDGLMKLPLLDSFSLKIPFIREDEWEILSEFLNKQTSLIVLKFAICKQRSAKDGYIEQNKHITSMLACFKNLLKLEHLALKLDFFPVESLSKALGELSGVTQLRTLKLEGLVLPPLLSKNTSSLVTGLGKFLKLQKKLSKLKINFPFLLEESIVKDILQTISKLTGLTKLVTYINSCPEFAKKNYISLYDKVFAVKDSVQVSSRNWHSEAIKTLRSLQKLEYLKMYVDTEGDMSTKEQKGLMDIFKVLQKLKTLRKLDFTLPFGKLSEDSENMIERALSVLDNGIFIKPRVSFRAYERRLEEIDHIIERVNQRQSLRTDLMF